MPKAKTLIHGAGVKEAARTRPRGKVLLAERPDFDKEFECRISMEAHAARLAVPLGKEGDKGKKAPRVSGYFAVLEKAKEGSASRVKVQRHKVLNVEGLRALLKSDAYKNHIREADPFATGGGPGGGVSTGWLPPNNEFIPLMGGPFSKQLYLHDYLDMHAKCFEAKNHNPLAKQIVDTITFFSIGKGVRVVFRNPELQKQFDYFYSRNRLGEFLRQDSDSVTWAGELMTHKTRFPDGFPALKHIDPSTVWEIITNPRDITEVYYYHQQYPTQYQMIYKTGDKSQEYVINDIPADEVIHVRINTVPGEKRGRSDLFPILGWLKRFRDYYDARITKAQVEESMVLRKKISGSAADVDAVFNDPEINRVPTPGSVLVENEAITTEYLTPSSSSTGSGTDNVGEAIRSICATGAGLSPEYLGVGGVSSTRATSITKSEPSDRKFEDRQQLFETYVRDICDWWLGLGKGADGKALPLKQVRPSSLAALKKAIKDRNWLSVAKEATALMTLSDVSETIDNSYEVVFPEIGTQDRTAKIRDLYTAQAMKSFSARRVSEMVAKELGVTSYNYDEEKEEINEEREEAMADPAYAGGADPAMDGLGRLLRKPAPDGAGTSAGDARHRDQS